VAGRKQGLEAGFQAAPLLGCEQCPHPEQPNSAAEHKLGLLFAVTGVLIIVPDATLVRLIDAPGLTQAAWRLVLSSIGLAAVLGARYGRELPGRIRALGPWGAVVSVQAGCASGLFAGAVCHTSVANVLLILATSSFWAALMSRAALGTRIECRTWIAMPAVFGGVAVAVSGGLNGESLRSGDVMAFLISVMGASRRTIMRAHSGIDMLPAMFIGSLLVGLLLSGWLALGGGGLWVPAQSLPAMLVLGLLVMPGAQAFLTAGSRRLNSAESSLIMCVETALSPIMVSCVVGEYIPPLAWLGGGVVIVALVCHAAWPWLWRETQG